MKGGCKDGRDGMDLTGGRTVVCGDRGDYACSAEEGEIQSGHLVPRKPEDMLSAGEASC